MRLALVLLLGLAALTDAFTMLEAHSTTTEKTPNSDEMESWQLRFQNGTTLTGTGMPPEIWIEQTVQEKKETKGSIDNLKGLRQFGWPPPFSPHVPGPPGFPSDGLRQLSPPIHPDLPGNTEGRGKGGLRQFPIFYGR